MVGRGIDATSRLTQDVAPGVMIAGQQKVEQYDRAVENRVLVSAVVRSPGDERGHHRGADGAVPAGRHPRQLREAQLLQLLHGREQHRCGVRVDRARDEVGNRARAPGPSHSAVGHLVHDDDRSDLCRPPGAGLVKLAALGRDE